jgi:hypothetical protein
MQMPIPNSVHGSAWCLDVVLPACCFSVGRDGGNNGRLPCAPRFSLVSSGESRKLRPWKNGYRNTIAWQMCRFFPVW